MHDQDATSYRIQSLASWQAAAPAWERERAAIWRAARAVSEWLVDHADPQPGERVLDIACGTGDTGLLAAQRVGPSGRLLSTDRAPEMVAATGRRADELGLTNVASRTLDAEAMDLDDGSFDVALCRWGFMLMADPLAALRETRRVLTEDGRLALAVWGTPDRNPWSSVLSGVFIERGLMPSIDLRSPGMFRLADRAELEALVVEAGFGEVSVDEIAVRWQFGSFGETWRVITSLSTSMTAAINRLGDGEVAEIRAEAMRRCAPYSTDSGVQLPGVSLVAVAR